MSQISRDDASRSLAEIKVDELQQENKELKKQLEARKEEFNDFLIDYNKLKKQLDNIKYLNEKNVERVLNEENKFPNYLKNKSPWYGDGSDEYDWSDRNKRITKAICKLAIPEQKYLSEKEVIKILWTSCAIPIPEDISKLSEKEQQQWLFEILAEEICKLAIDKSRIIEVLDRYFEVSKDWDSNKATHYLRSKKCWFKDDKYYNKDKGYQFEQIADEIIGG